MKILKLKKGTKTARIFRHLVKRKARMFFLLQEMNIPFEDLHKYGYRPVNPL